MLNFFAGFFITLNILLACFNIYTEQYYLLPINFFGAAIIVWSMSNR